MSTSALSPTPITTPIPLTAHFIWFGQELPWVHVLAVRSAAERGGFERLVFHHDQDLSGTRHFRALKDIAALELRRLDVAALLDRCSGHGPALKEIYRRLGTPAIRSDMVRYALLYTEGGVYLDVDTITIRSLRELCNGVQAFCGEEHLVYPLCVKQSRNPAVRAGALLRNGVREVFRLVPNGWSSFRQIEQFYARGLNPAVVGSAPHGRFITRAIARIVELPTRRHQGKCGIGPHLVQEIASEFAPNELTVHPPDVFYPLAPEISRHWFYVRKDSACLARVLRPATRVVHWYASVRTRTVTEAIDPDYVRAHAGRQFFSALALPFAT